MFGFTLIEVIIILGFLLGLARAIIGVRNHFKQKPIFQFGGYKLFEDNQTINYWQIKISNITSNGFILEKVFIKKHFFLFFYRQKSELNWHQNYDYHGSSNRFDKTDNIKPNMDVNIVVKPTSVTEKDKQYTLLNTPTKKLKFIFQTSLKKYKLIVSKSVCTETKTNEINFKIKLPKSNNNSTTELLADTIKTIKDQQESEDFLFSSEFNSIVQSIEKSNREDFINAVKEAIKRSNQK